MMNKDLSDLILSKFLPFVFTCGCKGVHIDCARALEDASVWAQRDTAVRIAQFISQLED